MPDVTASCLARRSVSSLPPRTGVGFKSDHFQDLLENPDPVGWIEIHAENYMVDGGPRMAQLARIRRTMPVSCHGVGLSIGGEGPLDPAHLVRLKRLVDWLQPAAVSEHLAWSSHGLYYNDLLPLPYTATTLQRVVDHIDTVQSTLARPILLENPASYLRFDESTMDEGAFLEEVARRAGCGLLLDVNNVHVSAINLTLSAEAYLNAFPLWAVEEIHLGGHDEEYENGERLLIDTHGRSVDDSVWALFETVLERLGPIATLIEWDNNVPDWPALRDEALRADRALNRWSMASFRRQAPHHPDSGAAPTPCTPDGRLS